MMSIIINNIETVCAINIVSLHNELIDQHSNYMETSMF